jgi:hypothetical protein
MKEIELTQGKVAFVDDEDFERLNLFKWYVNKNHNAFYAKRHARGSSDKIVWMHREIIGYVPEGYEIDHINGNGLDNRRMNLQCVTHRRNLQNNHKVNKTSKYPGVSWDKKSNIWFSCIHIKGKTINLGRFKSELDAHTAYLKKCTEVIHE